MEEIARAAEAVIYRDGNKIVKERIKKSYRHPAIDERLRLQRTRKEAKIIDKLHAIGVPCPDLILVNDKEKKIEMSYIAGPKVRDILTKDNCKKISEEIGEKIGLMHKAGIIHGDLTTSNMLQKGKIFFIDFGLSFESDKAEDKAVDLHLLRQALESKHYEIWEDCFKHALAGYKKTNPGADLIIKRLEEVEKRGRNKKKMG